MSPDTNCSFCHRRAVKRIRSEGRDGTSTAINFCRKCCRHLGGKGFFRDLAARLERAGVSVVRRDVPPWDVADVAFVWDWPKEDEAELRAAGIQEVGWDAVQSRIDALERAACAGTCPPVYRVKRTFAQMRREAENRGMDVNRAEDRCTLAMRLGAEELFSGQIT